MSDLSSEDGWRAFGALTSIVAAWALWAVRRLSWQVDSKASREELERMIQSQEDKEAIRQVARDEMHTQNSSSLNRIEKKIDQNEEESTRFRHDTRDQIQQLSSAVAVLNERIPKRR